MGAGKDIFTVRAKALTTLRQLDDELRQMLRAFAQGHTQKEMCNLLGIKKTYGNDLLNGRANMTRSVWRRAENVFKAKKEGETT
jgi:hypothetical protein